MGYLGSQATFTGTQNHRRVSKIAAQGQKDFTVDGGYDIGALDVFRNGVRLVTQRDFTAHDGVTVTLVDAANANDILEFVSFVNFQVDSVVTRDGDSTIKGNLDVNGNLNITGILGATVSNTAVAGLATEATRAGIATQVDGFLGVGVTATNLNATGVITATSFVGSGANLTDVISGVELQSNGNSVGTAVTAINFSGFSSVTAPTAGLSTVTASQTLTIGVRVGTAVTFNITGSSFNVPNRAGGNTVINI